MGSTSFKTKMEIGCKIKKKIIVHWNVVLINDKTFELIVCTDF